MAKFSSTGFWSGEVKMTYCDLDADLPKQLHDFLSLREHEAMFNSFNAL